MTKENASGGTGSVGGFIAGVILTMFGLIVSPVLLIVGIILIVRNKGAVAKESKKPAPRKSAPPKPPAAVSRPPQPSRAAPPAPSLPRQTVPAPRQTDGVSYQAGAQDHYHITNVGLPAERRLEQLEVMKNAGLLDKEEYQQRLQKILKDK